MTEQTEKTKRGQVVSTFRDANFNGAGEPREFEKGKEVTLPAGVFANYEHAGLVASPSAAAAPAKTSA